MLQIPVQHDFESSNFHCTLAQARVLATQQRGNLMQVHLDERDYSVLGIAEEWPTAKYGDISHLVDYTETWLKQFKYYWMGHCTKQTSSHPNQYVH